MALTTNRQKLFLLFSACLPENQSVQKDLLINTIIQMPEYKALQKMPCWINLSTVYSEKALNSYDIGILSRLPEAIKVVPNVLSQLEAGINHGNAWQLKPSDMPDWTSEQSLRRLAKKITYNPEERNLTNLTKENMLSIFLNSVERDPSSVLSDWTISDSMNIEIAVGEKLQGKLYCIPKETFEKQNALIKKSDQLLTAIQDSKKESKHLVTLRKGCTLFTAMLLALFMPPAFDIPLEGYGMFYLLAIVISIIYFIKG